MAGHHVFEAWELLGEPFVFYDEAFGPPVPSNFDWEGSPGLVIDITKKFWPLWLVGLIAVGLIGVFWWIWTR